VRHRLCDLTGRRPLGAPLNQRGEPDALHCRPGARAYRRATVHVPHRGAEDAALSVPHRVRDWLMLASAVAAGLLDGGIAPIIKHIPGHGRATVDSHKDLPIVSVSRDTLSESDFAPFAQMKDVLAAMSAHLLFTAIDDQRPGTVSPKVIEDVIRGEIGFENLLISDDLSMEALGGSIASRTHECLRAGCDIALHCNGKRTEMEEVVSMAPLLSGSSLQRAQTFTNQIATFKADVPDGTQVADWQVRLATLLAPVWSAGDDQK